MVVVEVEWAVGDAVDVGVDATVVDVVDVGSVWLVELKLKQKTLKK